MQPPCLFLVSSALKTRFGVFDYPSRLQQTIDTCNSISAKAQADIILIDGGQEAPSLAEVEYLRQHVVELVSFAQDAEVKRFQSIENHDIVKNGVELYMYAYYLKNLYETGLYRKYSRIFKMSGRYTLNEDFNLDVHTQAKGKIVISSPRSSQFSPELTGGVMHQYMSRLWSCDVSILDYVVRIYQAMLSEFIQVVNFGRYIDIEHLLYKHINRDAVVFPTSILIRNLLQHAHL
jgi:hypothetical protein